MIKKILQILIITFFINTLFSFSAMSETESPMESIKRPTQEIIRIMKDEKYKNINKNLKEEQWNEIWDLVKDSFEFSIISRIAVGRYWSKFSEQEKLQFRDLFAELLANTYISKVQENFRNQKVTFNDEKIIDSKKSEVTIYVDLGDKALPIIYKLIKKNNKWLIYDVNIEGMSMIKNYRSQFDDFLFKNSPAKLNEALKKKIDSLRKERKK